MITNVLCLFFILFAVLLSINWKVTLKVGIDDISIKIFRLRIFSKDTLTLIKKANKSKKNDKKSEENSKKSISSYMTLFEDIKIKRFLVIYGNQKISTYDYLLYGLIGLYNQIGPFISKKLVPICFKRLIDRDSLDISLNIQFKLIDIIYTLSEIRRQNG